jgi:hypothetical protein
MRSTFASSMSMRWPVTFVSESDVPSPLVTYISPSPPKHTAAPLCPSDSHSMIVFALFVSRVKGAFGAIVYRVIFDRFFSPFCAPFQPKYTYPFSANLGWKQTS